MICMICSSLNLGFILSPLSSEDSIIPWRRFRGSGHMQTAVIFSRGFHDDKFDAVADQRPDQPDYGAPVVQSLKPDPRRMDEHVQLALAYVNASVHTRWFVHY